MKGVMEAKTEERSTVMRSQMLLISCVAFRAPAIATMSHSTSKQRQCCINQKHCCMALSHIYKYIVSKGETQNGLPKKGGGIRSVSESFYRCIYSRLQEPLEQEAGGACETEKN